MFWLIMSVSDWGLGGEDSVSGLELGESDCLIVTHHFVEDVRAVGNFVEGFPFVLRNYLFKDVQEVFKQFEREPK